MPPKKKPKRKRCSLCHQFGHYTDQCGIKAAPVVGAVAPESAPATSPTVQISKSLSRDSLPPGQRGTLHTLTHSESSCSTSRDEEASVLLSASERDLPLTSAADDQSHGQRVASRTVPHHTNPSYADAGGPSCSSTHLPLSPPKKRLKTGQPEFATVSVPVTATSAAGNRATSRTSVQIEADCTSQEVHASSTDAVGPSCSTSSDLPSRVVTRALSRRQAESAVANEANSPDNQEINGIVFNEDMEVDISTVSSDEEAGYTNRCSCCHRCATPNYPIDLRNDVNVVTRRAFGDMNWPNFPLFCGECAAYLGTRDRDPSWAMAWPAVLFTFLTSDTISFDSQKLVEILPRTIKESFILLVPRLSASISAVWECPSKCVDATQKLKEFKTDLLKHAGILASKLNETCFPSVKCPMGCNTYIDGDVGKDVDYLPLHHYLSLLCPKFSSFKSNPNFFSGKRPDWPSRGKYEGFKYAATLIVDSKKGLCVVTCAKKIHADGRSLYIHVPCNPVLGSTSELRPDLIAPVSANPHFVRAGRSNEFSSSHVVFREYGDSSGASSFSLTPKPYVSGPCTVPQIDSMGLSLNQRVDICHSLMEGETLPNNLLGELNESYKNSPLDEERIRIARETGTYVDVHDASNILLQYNSRLAKGPQEETHKQLRAKGKEVLQIVHSGNNVGRLPFRFPRLSKRNGADGNGLVLHMMINTLLHSRHLHHLFLLKLQNQAQGSTHHILQAALYKVATGVKLTNPLRLEEQFLRMALDNTLCGERSRPHIFSQSIIAHMCDVEKVSIKRNFQALERIASRSEKILLVDCSSLNASEPPQTLCNGQWQLMMAHTSNFDGRNFYNLDFDFRWTDNLKWQHCSSDIGALIQAGDKPRKKQWQFLLYIESASVQSVSKVEFLNFSGGQTKLKCSEHQNYFMVKERPGSGLSCCTVGCQSSVRYRCGKGFGRMEITCGSGLCLKHANLILKSDAATTYVDPPLNGVSLPLLDAIDDEEVEDTPNSHILDGPPPLFPEEIDDVAEIFATPLDSLAGQVPVATEYVQPTYSRGPNSTSGHFLLNKSLNMMSRVDINRKQPVAQQNLLTHIHSIAPEQSLPLLYCEALLFPTIFWATVDKSVVGALPSVFYSDYGRKSVYGGFASLVDHLRVRLFDSSLLTSHDPNYIAFCFDVYLNSLLQNNSVSIALRKGLEHVNRQYVVPECREGSLKFDEADSRREVQRLSAMMAENPWDFFLTLTCNDSGTMGVAPIRRELEKRYHGKELDKKLQNACSLLCRAWARSVHYLFEFLMHGEEKIFGELKNIWFRYEFQNSGSPGNKPHVHAGLTLKDRTRNDNERIKRVHNNLQAMFNDANRTDRESLVNDGLVKDQADFLELYKLADRLTQHNCSKSGFKCMKITSRDGSKRCRVPRYLSSAEPMYLEHRYMYDVETQERLLKLGLGKRRYPPELDHLTELHNDVVVEPRLVGGRYNYAGEPGVRRVPSNGRIFAMLRSMVNVQICDLKFTSSYLAKYAAGADEKREVVITSTGKDATVVDVEPRDLYHAKISGSKIAHDQKMKAELAKESLCREITLTEMIWFTHQLPFVVCSADFVHCSTHAPEHRQAVYRKHGGYIQKLINEDGTLKGISLRAGFPSWRRFTGSQTLLMSEIVNSPYLVDNTSLFSVRPPELRKVMKLGDYLKWFTFTSAKVITVSEEVSECPWIDGSGKLVRVRKRYVDDVRRFFETLFNRAHLRPGTLEMYGLFEALHHEVLQGSNSNFVNRFVDMSADRDVIVVFTCIEPTSTHKFLVHLLLTLGSFVTELGIFRGPTLLHAFQYAHLIADANNPTEEEALSIIRLYVMTQLQSLPYGVKGFSRLLSLAMDALLNFFRTKGVDYVEVPLASLRAIRDDANTKLHEMEASRAQTLASVLETSGIKNCPAAAVLGSMRKFDFVPEIERLPGQSRSSYAEQYLCLNALVNAIDRFDRVGPVFVPCPIITGPPGAGKTHLLLTSCLYAQSKGLRTIITAATAERARSLGGEHIHLLFAMPTVKSQIECVPVTAEKCLLNLSASPVKMAYLKRLDVLVVEEIGLIPASLLNIIDFVLRRLRDTTVPFGGVLLLCCGDPCQLKPVNGRSIWLMPNFFTMFHVLCLKHFVRSRGDPELQTLIKCIRKTRLDDHDLHESIGIIRNRCAPHQFVKSWEDVPDEYQRVVGKNSAVDYAVSIYLKQKKATPGLPYIVQQANDEVEVIGGSWITASAAVSRQLTRQCKEPFELLLFCHQIVRLTYNNSTPAGRVPKFSQGQLAVILQLPDLSLHRHAQRITIKLVPPGVRVVSVDALPAEWPVFPLARRFTIPQLIQVHMSKAKREQWPFSYFVCTTVHRSIGETLPKLATQISVEDSMFSLWDKNQLLVILSRVQSLDDLLFVGDVVDTLRAIKKLLQVVDPWDAFIDRILVACDSIREGDGIIPSTCSYPSVLACVPTTDSGFILMVVSLALDSYRIDKAPSLRHALKVYNDPLALVATRSLRPWALACFITGFIQGNDDDGLTDFINSWMARIRTEHGNEARSHQALTVGLHLFAEERLRQPTLKWQTCLKLHEEEDPIGGGGVYVH